MGSQYNRLYDPKTVESVTGEVISVDKITPMKGMSYGVHDRETISVHLGLAWYIENQDIRILPNDKIEVTDSRITYQGKPVIIVAEIKKGDEVLKLRDENGYPMWAGWRKTINKRS
ncbi:MAG: DNA-binding protein [Candidatus Dadabacteria bacterium]|nr:DNA-binding protein [Candidatus Dadabacteria bacterium]